MSSNNGALVVDARPEDSDRPISSPGQIRAVPRPVSPSPRSLIERGIARALGETLTMDSFRDSQDIRALLDRVIHDTPELKALLVHAAGPRLEQIKEMLMSSLCFPLLTSLLGIGVSPTRGPNQLQVISRCIQMALLYFYHFEVELMTVGNPFPQEEGASVLEYGVGVMDKEEVDALRVQLVVALLQARQSAILSIEITLDENYVSIVSSLCCHVLGVRALSEDIVEAVHASLRAVKQLSAAGTYSVTNGVKAKADIVSSFAFAPSPVSKVAITPPAAKWELAVRDSCAHLFRWISKNLVSLARACRNVEVLHCVNLSVRASMKNEEYASPAALLRCYHASYRDHLTNIVVPWVAASHMDVLQAVKDLRRECSMLNGCVYTGDDIERAVERELGLVVAARFQLPADAEDPTPKSEESIVNEAGKEISEICLAVTRSDDSKVDTRLNLCPTSSSLQDQQQLSLCRETYTLLLNYVLIAASRTSASGDAFFIVQDLYGGDGLVLCSTAAPRASSSVGTSPNSPSRAAARSGPTPSSESTTSSGSVTVSIAMVIDSSYIDVQVTEYFALLTEEAIASAATAAKRLPLVRFKCITRTRIRLASLPRSPSAELLAAMQSMQVVTPQSAIHPEKQGLEPGAVLYRYLLHSAEEAITKKISIEPFL
jgi:hypothetical protein